jgi:hypothetical protein
MIFIKHHHLSISCVGFVGLESLEGRRVPPIWLGDQNSVRLGNLRSRSGSSLDMHHQL